MVEQAAATNYKGCDFSNAGALKGRLTTDGGSMQAVGKLRFRVALILGAFVAMTAVSEASAEGEPNSPEMTAATNGTRHGTRNRVRRRRREADPGRAISTDKLAVISQYLRACSSGVEPAAHERAAWHEFYQACDESIGRFAASLRLRGSDAEDCRQEVWADLVRSLPGFKLDQSRGRFSSWLYTVVRSKATDLQRRRLRQPFVDLAVASRAMTSGAKDDPLAACQQRAERETVRRVLSLLRQSASAQSFRVAQLRWIEQREVNEVADLLGITPGQVWVREHRMREKFRTLYENHAPPLEEKPTAATRLDTSFT